MHPGLKKHLKLIEKRSRATVLEGETPDDPELGFPDNGSSE